MCFSLARAPALQREGAGSVSNGNRHVLRGRVEGVEELISAFGDLLRPRVIASLDVAAQQRREKTGSRTSLPSSAPLGYMHAAGTSLFAIKVRFYLRRLERKVHDRINYPSSSALIRECSAERRILVVFANTHQVCTCVHQGVPSFFHLSDLASIGPQNTRNVRRPPITPENEIPVLSTGPPSFRALCL